jgi:transcriptional regulator with XRE-family HTH domain
MEDSARNIFAERLKYARETLRQLTQSDLASRAGLPSTSISHFENPAGSRKPSFDNLRRLANALDVTTDYLLGRTDNPVGASMNEALYRDVQMLNEADKEFANQMIRQLVERRKKEE